MSFCFRKWAVIYVGITQPFVWAIIPHVITIILCCLTMAAILLARRSHPLWRREDHSAEVVFITGGWRRPNGNQPEKKADSSQADESAFAPLHAVQGHGEDAAAVCRKCATCLLPVYNMLTVVLVAVSGCLE